MLLSPQNFLAIIAGAVSAFVIGIFWYAVLFRSIWSNAQGFSEQKMHHLQKSAPLTTVVSFVGYLITGYVLCVLFQRLGIVDMKTALSTVFLVWLGFPLPMGLMNSMYAGRSLVVLLIDVGYQLVYLLVMGAILVWLG